jgi:hypothetical protein
MTNSGLKEIGRSMIAEKKRGKSGGEIHHAMTRKREMTKAKVDPHMTITDMKKRVNVIIVKNKEKYVLIE